MRVEVECPKCAGSGKVEHLDCMEHQMVAVDHERNALDWDTPTSYQGYQVYRCKVCGDYWGCRRQWDAGTGIDNHWHNFGQDASKVYRHY